MKWCQTHISVLCKVCQEGPTLLVHKNTVQESSYATFLPGHGLLIPALCPRSPTMLKLDT